MNYCLKKLRLEAAFKDKMYALKQQKGYI